MDHKITELFYFIDEFCKEFERVKEGHILREEVTKKHRNRKYAMNDSEEITIVVLFHLKKRALIEVVNDELKNICQIEHTRHRSFENFIANLMAGLIAYSYLPPKSSLNLEIIDNEQICKFA